MTRMTASDKSKKQNRPRSRSAQRASSAQAVEPQETSWHKALLWLPRALGKGVRALTGSERYDPAYSKDGLCFLLLICAILFCASEWFRVQGPLGKGLHWLASSALGLPSVILPLVLIWAFWRLIAYSGKDSGNGHSLGGLCLLLWSVCSVLDIVMIGSIRRFDLRAIQGSGGLLGFALGSPLAWGLSRVFATIIFALIALFALLLIFQVHIDTLISPITRSVDRKRQPAQPEPGQTESELFPNEVRVGDDTLALAPGVPTHEDDQEEQDTLAAPAKTSWFHKLFHRRRKGRTTPSSTITRRMIPLTGLRAFTLTMRMH